MQSARLWGTEIAGLRGSESSSTGPLARVNSKWTLSRRLSENQRAIRRSRRAGRLLPSPSRVCVHTYEARARAARHRFAVKQRVARREGKSVSPLDKGQEIMPESERRRLSSHASRVFRIFFLSELASAIEVNFARAPPPPLPPGRSGRAYSEQTRAELLTD